MHEAFYPPGIKRKSSAASRPSFLPAATPKPASQQQQEPKESQDELVCTSPEVRVCMHLDLSRSNSFAPHRSAAAEVTYFHSRSGVSEKGKTDKASPKGHMWQG
eukprot:scaffold315917_cov15-Tisochrysis_lutea.AAC.1